MILLKQENCCMVAKWECWGPLREAVCILSVLTFLYSRPCFSRKMHPSPLQLLCPAHCLEQKRENVSERKESSGKPGVRRADWMGQQTMFSPSTMSLEGWTFESRGWSWKLRQQKVPSPVCEPCHSCLEASRCGTTSPGLCVKGTGKLSGEDGSEQTCSGVGVRCSAIQAAPAHGFLTYQDTPFFFILFPHTLFVFLVFLTSSISHSARELPCCPLLGAPQ